MKKILLLILSLALFVRCSQPETEVYGSISGLVKDSQNGVLLSDVRISLSPGGTSQITGNDGTFSFEDLKSGEYSLSFSKDGYEDESTKISVKTGVAANVQITMTPIQPKMNVSNNALSFGEDATSLSLDISNIGKGTLEWEITNDVDWIECTPSSGSCSIESNTVVVTARRDNLDQGNYSGSFVISSNGGSATILVSISINGITLQVDPAELDFGTITSSLQLKLTNTASGTLAYEAKSSNDWLTLNKPSGNITTNDYITAIVSRQGLSAGIYNGNISFSTKKGALSVPVKMEIVVNEKPSVTVEGATNIKYNSAMLQGTVVSAGSSKITKYGFCWSEKETPTLSDYYSNLGDCSDPRAFEANATGLKSETKYFYRAYAENSVGISYSEKTLSFTTAGMPTKPSVTTGDVADITNSSAKVKGMITSLGNVEKIIQHGHVWSTKPSPTLDNGTCSKLGEATATSSFVSTLENLETAQTYYVRAYATNEKGTSYGEEKSFVTSKSDPKVQTAEVTDIVHNSAVCGGTVTFTGGHEFTEVGVCWGKSSMPTVSGNKVKGELIDGSFTCKITDLTKETKYFVRAYVKTDDGNCFYGEDKAFQTTKEVKLPELAKVTVIDITTTSSSFESKITSNGNGKITECGFCWSDVTTPTVLDNKIDCDPSSTYLGKTIQNLKEGTKYYVCAYAKNAMGIAYSEVVEFTTIAITLAELSNITVSEVTASSVGISGTINSNGNSEITACGFVWGESPYPTTADNVESSKLGSTSLYVKLSNLKDGSTYYARSFATNGKGTAYSEQKKFTTLTLSVPSLTTPVISNVGRTSAYAQASISDSGNSDITEVGFCWSTSPYPTTSDNKIVCTLGNSFNTKMTGLPVLTTVYIRAYSVNAKGTGYSESVSATTIETDTDIWDGTIATKFTSGSGTETDPIIISSGAELALLSQRVNSGTTFSGVVFKLMSNISLSNLDWTGIGTFKGNFDGNGMVISDFKSSTALFKENQGVIKNVSIKGEVTSSADYAAGICQKNINGIIRGCKSYVNVRGKSYVGGIVGSSSQNSSIDECENYGSITATGSYIGGICGRLDYEEFSSTKIISDNVNYGPVYGKESVGGIIGYAYVYKYSGTGTCCLSINNCNNCGGVDGENSIGGIIGYSCMYSYGTGNYYAKLIIHNCCNNTVKGLIGAYKHSNSHCSLNYYGSYWLYDIVNNIGQENPICSESGSGSYFTRTSSACYLKGNTSSDIVALLNKWVSDQTETSYYRWKYEVVDGYARPVFDK